MTEHRGPHVPPSREATVSSWVARAFAQIVERAGVPQDKLLEAAGVDAELMGSPDGRLPRSIVYRLCERGIELTGDPALGLHWAARMDTSAFPPISYLLAHSATLRDALESLSQFQPLLTDHLGFERIERGNLVIVRCFPLPGESLTVQRFTAEMMALGMFRLVRLFNPSAPLERASFAYPAPDYRQEYTRVFEGIEQFEQRFTGIVFNKALLDAPSPHKDPDLHETLRSVVERRLMRLTARMPYALRVRDFLVHHGAPHPSEMRTVAQSLGISVRSLRRRLSAEGKPYNAILKDAYAIIAKRLLLDKKRTIQETAHELGFSDATAFHRAFKRWTGMTPLAFRQRELGDDPEE